MKAYCDYNEYEIAGEYEDAGKSGKSIEGRIALLNWNPSFQFASLSSDLANRLHK